jgi:putative flavoprotein involved in K+ transport
MRQTQTVVIGGGQAGLAMSRCLVERGIGHVVIERGRLAERWHSERWDSLRLLTPNWQSRLPGFRYTGPDPDGYMTMPEVIDYLERYARSFAAPVLLETTVLSVERSDGGFSVVTDRGEWHAPSVVIATGHCAVPFVPSMSRGLRPEIVQLTPSRYRRPSQLPDGGVLVVGASASGIQLADEIHASGRPVTISVGHHTRLPRHYRGKDILWWLDAMGIFDATPGEVFDVDVSRNQPSLQLVGRPDHASLDLGVLASRGISVVGRVHGIDGHRISLADDLVATTAADAKLATLMARIDEFVAAAGLGHDVGRPEPFEPIWPSFVEAPTTLDLQAAGITSVVWATGFRRNYSWLNVPVLDADGEIAHLGGVTPEPGLYALGLPFQRRRKSAFIDGVGDDAREITEHVAGFLAGGHDDAFAMVPMASKRSPS